MLFRSFLMKEREVHEQRLGELTKQSEKIALREEKLKAADRAGGIAPMLVSYEELARQERMLQDQIREWELRLEETNARKKEKELSFQNIARQREEQESGIRLKLQSAKEAWEQWKELPGMQQQQQELQKKLSMQQEQLKDLEKKQEHLIQEEITESQNIHKLETSLLELKVTADYRDRKTHV